MEKVGVGLGLCAKLPKTQVIRTTPKTLNPKTLSLSPLNPQGRPPEIWAHHYQLFKETATYLWPMACLYGQLETPTASTV
jgi:hypothetical protein